MSKGKAKVGSRSWLAIALAGVVLLGGVFIASRMGQNPQVASQAATGSGPVAGEEAGWYVEVSIQRVADVIAGSEHALIYYRSPT